MTKRDLSDYHKRYKNQPYEEYQAGFRRREVLRVISEFPHESMLEVGCGLESIFLHLDSFTKLTVVEPSVDFFNKASHDSGGRESIVLINAALEEARHEIKKEKFDFILISSLLHEVPHPDEFMNVVRDICQEDTVIHINVPNAFSFHRLLAVEMGLIEDVHEASLMNASFQQHSVFDRDSLSRIVKGAGFNIIGGGAYALKPFTHAQMQNMIDSELLSPEMLEGLFDMGKQLPEFCSEIYVNVKKQKARF